MTIREKRKIGKALGYYLSSKIIAQWEKDTRHRIPTDESLYLSLVSGYFGEVEKIGENELAIWIEAKQSANDRIMRFRWEINSVDDLPAEDTE